MKNFPFRFCLLAMAFAMLSCQKQLDMDTTAKRSAVFPRTSQTTIFANGNYQLVAPGDFDPLWRFTKSGNSMQLETDPTVTSWGTDYWGYWKDPYPLANNNTINYIIGLTNTTYAFTVRDDGKVDVSKTLVVSPYLGGEPTTTVTHMGWYELQDGDTGGGGGGNGWTTLSLENFEDGFINWSAGGADAGLYSKKRYAHEGRAAAYIQGNNGAASAIVQQPFNAGAFTQLEISFWYYATSMENGENFLVQFDNGNNNWVTIASYTSDTNFSNNRFYHPVISISSSSYYFGSNNRFRIMCNASDNKDDVYIDDIQVRGFN